MSLYVDTIVKSNTMVRFSFHSIDKIKAGEKQNDECYVVDYFIKYICRNSRSLKRKTFIFINICYQKSKTWNEYRISFR